jgi:selenide,water dikinase
MLRASGVAATLRWADVPLLEGARELALAGHIPGGTKRNLADTAADVTWDPGVPEAVRLLMADAQTSGGLLLCVAPDRVGDLLTRLKGRIPVAAVIGEVIEGQPGRISVT